jgi:hypothetical protein
VKAGYENLAAGLFDSYSQIVPSRAVVNYRRVLKQSTIFAAHRNLSDQMNRDIIRSEIEGGVYLKDLPEESTLQVETQNRWYTLVVRRDGLALISGHPEFCPEPIEVRITGSNWGGSMLKTAYLGRGMHLEYRHPHYRGPIITSEIVEIRRVA